VLLARHCPRCSIELGNDSVPELRPKAPQQPVARNRGEPCALRGLNLGALSHHGPAGRRLKGEPLSPNDLRLRSRAAPAPGDDQ
jgi:hypothetical protein